MNRSNSDLAQIGYQNDCFSGVEILREVIEESHRIPETHWFGERIAEMPGKQGLTAFINTNLNESLQKQHIKDLAFAGAVCSMCIDSTWWTAFDKGYNVTLLSDCVSGKTVFELTFNCENVFPLYPKRMLAQCYIKELSG